MVPVTSHKPVGTSYEGETACPATGAVGLKCWLRHGRRPTGRRDRTLSNFRAWRSSFRSTRAVAPKGVHVHFYRHPCYRSTEDRGKRWGLAHRTSRQLSVRATSQNQPEDLFPQFWQGQFSSSPK